MISPAVVRSVVTHVQVPGGACVHVQPLPEAELFCTFAGNTSVTVAAPVHGSVPTLETEIL